MKAVERAGVTGLRGRGLRRVGASWTVGAAGPSAPRGRSPRAALAGGVGAAGAFVARRPGGRRAAAGGRRIRGSFGCRPARRLLPTHPAAAGFETGGRTSASPDLRGLAVFEMAKYVCGSVALGCLFLMPSSPASGGIAAAPAPQGPAELQFTGTLDELWVAAPGHVQFRLRGTGEDGEQRRIWFDTPADLDANTHFEELALSMLRHAHDGGLQVTVQAERSSGDDGSVATKAFDIVRVGLRID